MQSVIIFCNGQISNYTKVKLFLSSKPFIVCANGGSRHALKLGLTPNITIGDFDSLRTSPKLSLNSQQTKFIKYPKEKDYTDSDLALQYAVKQGFNDIVIFGALGDRLDHFLGTLSSAAALIRMNLQIKFITDTQILYLTKDKIEIRGKVGDTVSLIPFQDDVIGVSTTGLKYPLYNETLFFGKTRGNSNIMIKSQTLINIRKGILLAICPLR